MPTTSSTNISLIATFTFSTQHIKPEIPIVRKCTFLIPDRFIYGRDITIYDKERTICDILRARNKMDKYVLNEAIKHYVKSKEKDIHKLTRFAKIFRVEKVLDSYLEVLL